MAPPRTDLFVAPGDVSESSLNAPILVGVPPAGDFQFAAHVTVDFAASFDAGVLLLWANEGHWAKLCFERSPAGEPMIVSVVNRGVSDDANGLVVEGNSAWLRISRVDGVFAFHASRDGARWELVRVFELDAGAAETSVGFEVQSPMGDGCAVTFERIAFASARLDDLRDGS
jgi:regulation of enolase protein 1 (concanavalin A-like superfamily)